MTLLIAGGSGFLGTALAKDGETLTFEIEKG